MPKLLDPELKARAVRLVLEHRGEYPTTTAAVAAVARVRLDVGPGPDSQSQVVENLVHGVVGYWLKDILKIQQPPCDCMRKAKRLS